MDIIFYVLFDEKKEYNEDDVNNSEINFSKVSSSILKFQLPHISVLDFC